MKNIRFISLFDGMGCLAIALKELDIKVDRYYSCEIDKFANIQTKENFPDIIQLGDVTKWKEWDIDWSKIDLIGAGSPCQGFSFAGKQLAFNDPRSALFFVFVEILNHAKKFNPNVKFLLENVDMKKEYLRIISEYVGVFPVNLNSNRVSAQNRNRWYWTNIRVKKVGLFDELYTDIPQPEDKGILLKDILQPESEVDEKYYLSNKLISGLQNHANNRKQDWTFNASGGKAKAITVPHLKQNLDSNYVCVPNTESKDNLILQVNPSKESGGKQPYQQNRVYHVNGQMPALMTEYRGNILIPEATTKGYAEIEPGECVDLENPNSKTRRGRKMTDKSNCLMSAQNSFAKYTEDFKLRRLTPIECSRLQTIPDWYKWTVSDSQIYRMLGNGWTVDIIKNILSFL